MKQFGTQPKARPLLSRQECNLTDEPPTVLLGGAPRSGTSALAALIDAMGIEMDDSFDGHFERIYFKDDLEEKQFHQAAKHIKELNASGAPWGTQLWQNPEHFDYMIRRVRNPVVVVVLRDVAGMVARWETVGFGGVSQGTRILRASYEINRVLAIYQGFQCPAIAVSFEKMKQDPEATFDELARILKRPKEGKKEAISRINKGSGYLIQEPPIGHNYGKMTARR